VGQQLTAGASGQWGLASDGASQQCFDSFAAGGSKNRPFFRVVVTESSAAREPFRRG
jgi:hypothetical protein